MPEERQGASLTTVFSVCFTVIAIVALFALVVVKSRADDATQTTTLTNAAPTLTVTNSESSVGASIGGSTLSLVEGATKTVYVYGTVSDDNGCSDFTNAVANTVKLYRTGQTAACAADNNDCYSTTDIAYDVGSCTGPGDLDATYETSFSVEYYADPTDAGSPNAGDTWRSTVTVTDASLDTGTTDSATFEMNSLIAVSLSGNVNYGSLALGATSASDETVVFTNSGNRDIDTTFSSAAMTCTGSGSDTIPADNAHIALASGFVYGAGQALGSGNLDLNLVQRTGAASTDDVYFKIQIPSSGVGGICSNTVTFVATDAALLP